MDQKLKDAITVVRDAMRHEEACYCTAHPCKHERDGLSNLPGELLGIQLAKIRQERMEGPIGSVNENAPS